MSEQPLVSIIIPTYNRAHLISETLDSVLAQTYQNWECVIVDDGSSDNTDEIVGDYVKKDSRFKYYHRPDEHLPGGNGARNYGFKMSQGDYVNWLDSDDVFLPKKLDIHLKAFKKKNNLDATVSKSYLFNFKSKKAYLPWRKKLYSENLLFDFIKLEAGWQTSDAMWNRKSIFYNPFNEKLKSYQDWEFHLKSIINKDKYYLIDKCLVHIRHTPNSIKNVKKIENHFSIYNAHKSIFNYLKSKKSMTNEIELFFLDKFYFYFSLFSYNRKIIKSLDAFIIILSLSIKTNKINLFFHTFFIKYPSKLFK